MKRRHFLQSIAALVVAPALPSALPKSRKRIYDGGFGRMCMIPNSERYKIYCSPETIEDIRRWGVDQIDETTRKQIYVNHETKRFFGVNWVTID